MSFVSYAQNYEDVMLARAFKGLDLGFYIDVGAQDPRLDSVSKAFYDRGWQGINIEPVRLWHEKLQAERPRDRNLRMAAGAGEGTIELHEVADSGLSTMRADLADRHRASGLPVLAPQRVPMRSLDAICADEGVGEVHFLKIDVEGAEAEVLRGLSLSQVRPWVLLVEATEPNSRASAHQDWEPRILASDYRFVYQDGLNRFYLAAEHAELASAFASPPNIFDDFIRREQVDEAARLVAEIEAREALLQERVAHIHELGLLLDQARREVAEQAALRVADLAEFQHREAQFEQRQAAQHASFSEHHAAQEASFRQREVALESRLAELGARLQQAERGAARLAAELMAAQADLLSGQGSLVAEQARVADLQAAMHRLHLEHQRVLDSRSWRVTAPLRDGARALRGAGRRLDEAARGLARLPFGRRLAAALLAPFPSLAVRIKRRLYGAAADAPATDAVTTTELPLTDDAEEILRRFPVSDRKHES